MLTSVPDGGVVTWMQAPGPHPCEFTAQTQQLYVVYGSSLVICCLVVLEEREREEVRTGDVQERLY